MKKYQIEVTERQLQLLSYACEKADRQIIGQLDISLENDLMDAWEREYKKDNNIKGYFKKLPEEWYYVQNEVQRHIDELRKLCWHQDRCTMYGIHYDETADTLFDMHCVFRHALWESRPEEEKSNWTVDASEHTYPYGDEPNAKIIKVIDDGKEGKQKRGKGNSHL